MGDVSGRGSWLQREEFEVERVRVACEVVRRFQFGQRAALLAVLNLLILRHRVRTEAVQVPS